MRVSNPAERLHALTVGSVSAAGYADEEEGASRVFAFVRNERLYRAVVYLLSVLIIFESKRAVTRLRD